MSENKNDRGCGGLRRPRIGEKRSYSGRKCDVRLSAEEDSMLDTLVKQNNVSRSDVVRKALRDFYRWNTENGG